MAGRTRSFAREISWCFTASSSLLSHIMCDGLQQFYSLQAIVTSCSYSYFLRDVKLRGFAFFLRTLLISVLCVFNPVMFGRKVLKVKEIASSIVGGELATPVRTKKHVGKQAVKTPIREMLP